MIAVVQRAAGKELMNGHSGMIHFVHDIIIFTRDGSCARLASEAIRAKYKTRARDDSYISKPFRTRNNLHPTIYEHKMMCACVRACIHACVRVRVEKY